MKNNFRSMVLAAALAVCSAAVLTGCGQARTTTDITAKQTDAPVIKVTEKATEAPQTETEPQTQKVTETQAPQTETQAPQTETQAPQTETQAQTQAQTTAALSKEEEIAQESEYEDWKTMWASDDINVREFPTTEEDNIFYSLDQGQTATVIGETPNWYEITMSFTDDEGTTREQTGFVAKQFMSDTEVQPKTEEERAAAAAAAQTAPETDAAAAQTAADQTASAPQTADQTASVQQTAPAGGTTVTMGSDANIRSDASQTSEVLGTVSAGEQVTVIGDADGWYQIDYNGVQGYVNKNLVG